MVALDPLSIGLGVAKMGIGLAQADASKKAEQQNYLNQTAFQDATSEFNSWQAGFNADLNNLNKQYNYWGEKLNYGQESIYSSQLTNYEFAKELQQAEFVLENRTSAAMDYAMTQEALTAQLQERGVQEAVALQQYQYRALQASAAYQAAGQEGKSMDRYVRNFARQAADQVTLAQMNRGMRERQFTREQMGAITKYLSQYNSQDFYIKSPIQEPVMPFAPLPTMMLPSGPTMKGAAPSGKLGVLDYSTAAVQGVGSTLNTQAAINTES